MMVRSNSSWRRERIHRSAYALACGDRGGVGIALIPDPANAADVEYVPERVDVFDQLGMGLLGSEMPVQRFDPGLAGWVLHVSWY